MQNAELIRLAKEEKQRAADRVEEGKRLIIEKNNAVAAEAARKAQAKTDAEAKRKVLNPS